ncbi:hypothetical protein RSK20926_13989 [Roseobacter sp. SK209-2-6]|nr:hypothetical protein RSK20926_13989 [Roseobacter sp. SK209-2-6]
MVSLPVAASPLSRILAKSPLTPEDFDAMRAAEVALYSHADVGPGSSVKWSNPDSSAHGVVKVTRKSGGCLTLSHVAYPNGSASAREIDRKFCRGSNGAMLLSE